MYITMDLKNLVGAYNQEKYYQDGKHEVFDEQFRIFDKR